MTCQCPTPATERPPQLRITSRVARAARFTLLALIATAAPALAAAAKFSLDDVVAKAEKLAKAPFQEPKVQVPEWLTKITYDQWRDVRFRPEQALWKEQKLPFQIQLFHPGLFYNRTVSMNTVGAKGARPLAFSPSQFDYGQNDFASKVPQNLGYAGFRLHAPIKTPNYYDEVIVFLGATYFRAVGKSHVFGISARGLAVDTASSSGEEFPYFKEIWLATPAKDAKELTVYALLDSPSLTGAYRFVIKPGEQTTVDVDARLFARREVKKLGIAPLTSMFFHGENTARPFEDFRPEVHDSDGLLLNFASGEWLWRPLDNPARLNISGFRTGNPKGFGLLQRDRDFDHYQDLETRTELRPSVWVSPRGDWAEGRIELVEIPTKSDTNDNVVAYWVPDQPLKAGASAFFAYSMAWYTDDPVKPPGARVLGTRRDRGNQEDAYRFVVDFAGKKLEALAPDTVLRGVVTVVGGDSVAELLDQHVIKNPLTGGWRLTFQVRPKKRDPVEIRAFLDKGGDTLTETWSYVLLP